MRVFGHKVPRNFTTNLFYWAMRRAFRLKQDIHFVADTGMTDEEVIFCLDRGAVERSFVEFVDQPFVDEEILQRTAAALCSFAWQFRVQRVTQSSAAILFGLAALPIWALYFRQYGVLAFALISAVLLFAGTHVSLDFIKDEERLGYLPKTSAYKTMIAACETGRALIDFKLQGSVTIDQLIERYHAEVSAE